MTSWRLLTASLAGIAVIGLGVGEGVARATLDHRLARADDATMSVEFVGTSALWSLATRTMPLHVQVEVSALGEVIAESTDATLSDVESTDGMLGLVFDDGLGPIPGPTTAWVSLAAEDGVIEATVVSIGVGELQFQPGVVLGDDLVFPVSLGQGRCDAAAPIDDVTVTDEAIELSLTASASTLSCLTNLEEA
ncbi:hypothetical protein [Demequina sp. NBRC 110054]|uniref:hypothetical protein n=1 Tax=Demequina sp. NBRC 110054 TaxID=1570343 RepID=UPI001177F6B4|nr:hypothetical protein [Demequina sp. NBRC 110054]